MHRVSAFFSEHNHTSSGKKMVTGVQVITASQVQIIQRLRYIHHSQATPLATHFWKQIIDPA